MSKALQKGADKAAADLALLANPRRLRLLCRLAEGEASVLELAAAVGLSQSAMSQHLALLRSSRMVATRREGTQILYRLLDAKVARLLALLHDIYCAKEAKK